LRATKDVDFLVGDEGFEHHRGGIVTFNPALPIRIGDVPVDTLASDAVTEDQVEEPLETEGIPIVEPAALVYLKLKAWRRRDQEDVVELLRAGLDDRPVRAFLDEHASELVDRFEVLVARAVEEG